MPNTLLTPEVKDRIERRFEFAIENSMHANRNYDQYKQDVQVLMAEISRLEAELENIDRENGFLSK